MRFASHTKLANSILVTIIIASLIAAGSGFGFGTRYFKTSPIRVLAAGSLVTPVPDAESPANNLYIPMVINHEQPYIELLDAWTSDSQGVIRISYGNGDEMQYWVSGSNNFSKPTDVNLKWELVGPCGEGEIFNESVTVDPGEWQHATLSISPDCTGVYTSTVQLTHQDMSPSLSIQFSVNLPSMVVVSDQQGFDRCLKPEIEEMQTWWDSSPYRVFNIYLGGDNYYCKNTPFDAIWVNQVAQQGWQFIETWVGLQAPCSKYTHKFSYNAETAYNQGRAEAQAAADAALALGFTGENIIYFDMEGYSDYTSSCRTAVHSFLRGWTEQLHELGIKSGAYGASCNSYMSEWADINPPPDDVWIAHWYLSTYNPDASVWDARCLSNELWPDHQRLRQYAGDHSETWGGVPLVIDSNVLDGEIVELNIWSEEDASYASGVLLVRQGTPIQEARLLGPSRGYIVVEGHLLVTEDRGQSWQDITPLDVDILDVDFTSAEEAWLVSRSGVWGELSVSITRNGGIDWSTKSLTLTPLDWQNLDRAYINPLGPQTAWLVLKELSGSSFSPGRLFLTEDGGETWQERTVPLGEPVYFMDTQTGWVAGGPAGDQLFRTTDGGRSWQPQDLALPSASRMTLGLPAFIGEEIGWLPVGLQDERGDSLALYQTRDSGSNWDLVHDFPIRSSFQMTNNMMSGFIPLLESGGGDIAEMFTPEKLPQGAISLGYTSQGYGWAVIQDGYCEGDKLASANAPLRCEQRWQLLASDDYGYTWRAIELGGY